MEGERERETHLGDEIDPGRSSSPEAGRQTEELGAFPMPGQTVEEREEQRDSERKEER